MTATLSPRLKDLYEISEIPPLGHVAQSMYAWCIRQERHGAPEKAPAGKHGGSGVSARVGLKTFDDVLEVAAN